MGIPSKSAPAIELIRNASRVFILAQEISNTKIRMVRITQKMVIAYCFTGF
jgi:hypothetical protein